MSGLKTQQLDLQQNPNRIKKTLTHTHRCNVGDSFKRKPLLQTHGALTEVCVLHTAELLTHTDLEPLMTEPCYGHTHACATHSATARANTLTSHSCMHAHPVRELPFLTHEEVLFGTVSMTTQARNGRREAGYGFEFC